MMDPATGTNRLEAVPEQGVEPRMDGIGGTGGRDGAPPSSSRRTRVIVAVAAGVLLLGVAQGVVRRRRHQAELEEEAARLADERIPVQAAAPQLAPASMDVTLPAAVEALQETVIFSRVSGYVKRWQVDIGDKVSRGQRLAVVDTPELDQELERARTNAELARVTYQRYQALAPAGVVSQQDLDVAHAGVQASQAEVQRLTEMKGFAEIAAPFSGVITERMTEVGSLVTPGVSQGQALFRIAKTDPIRVFVHVPQKYAPSVRRGQAAQVLIREYPGRKFSGKVTRRARALDPATRMMLTEIQVPNSDNALFPGMYAQVSIAMTSAEKVFLVPSTALVISASGTQVSVVGPDNTIHMQTVHVATDYGKEVAVDSGLRGDERIVTFPGERTGEGARVVLAGASAEPQGP